MYDHSQDVLLNLLYYNERTLPTTALQHSVTQLDHKYRSFDSPRISQMSQHRNMSADMEQTLGETIVLLSMLGNSISSQTHQPKVKNDISEPKDKWRCLLDQLSWLCDYNTGGKIVISIAAQTVGSGHLFWFASNGQVIPQKIGRHLQWIPGELKAFVSSPASSKNKTHSRLFKKCVAFSYRRVEFYVAKLESLAQSARHLQQGVPEGQACRTPDES